jgi:hypothetical protein
MLHKYFLLCLAVLLVLTPVVVSLVSGQVESNPTNNNSDACFSIIQLSDIQYPSWSNPSLLYATTEWIVNNSQSYNIKMVVHTGDLVDTPTHTSEWEVANSAMLTLLNNGIPYCWDAGNHDQLPPNETADLWLGDSNTDWLGSQYPAFNQTAMEREPYWVSDTCDGKNTAVTISFDNYRVLIINLEFLANSSALNWMQNLIEANPSTNVIVATHDYLNRTGGYGTRSISNDGVLDYTWGSNFNDTLNQYPNIFLTLSGHILSRTTGAYNQRVDNREEVFFNRQEIDNRLGAAAVRIYSFDLNNMQVDVSTYALDNQTWLTDSYNHFNFSISLIPTIQPTASPSATSNPTLATLPNCPSNPTLTVAPTPTVSPQTSPKPIMAVPENSQFAIEVFVICITSLTLSWKSISRKHKLSGF